MVGFKSGLTGTDDKNRPPPNFSGNSQPGEGVADERTFTGRMALLRDLRALWKQPHGKPAIMLTGQRRIGKTTLLHKIQRDGLENCKLLPVYISVQDCDGEYDFLDEVARKTTEALNILLGSAHLSQPSASEERSKIAPAILDEKHPRADFKSFLLDLRKKLAGWRFLLMLDEADLIPSQNLGTLPGFLRGLMQGPEYPTLLLFCGTYKLKRMGWDYNSILFNTVHEFTVTYMSETESAEVLEKPARGILEFDPLVLRDAYRLTRGQPLLLLLLGEMLSANLTKQCWVAWHWNPDKVREEGMDSKV